MKRYLNYNNMQETIKNLTKAFIGESQARNRYTMYSKIAKKEGYEQISAIFAETADQEAEHAKWLFRLINQLKKDAGEQEFETIAVEAEAPTALGTTAENLQAAIDGENYEHTSMYPEFADTADKENLPEIAARLRAIAKAEDHHEDRYKRLLETLKNETTFNKEEETEWVCRKCGYIHKGTSAPEKCPACGHPQAYYQARCEQY